MTTTARPKLTITCCLCHKPVRSDVFTLDAEWRRRHPDMTGNLACRRCALGDENYWTCDPADPRHVPCAVELRAGNHHGDAWDHVTAHSTPVAAVLTDPRSAARQGAADYLRHKVHGGRLDPDTAARYRSALAACG